MKSTHVILLLMLGAALDTASRTYLQSHKALDAVIAGMGTAGVMMVAGLTPSPAQAGAIIGQTLRLVGVGATAAQEAPAGE